MSAAKAKRCGPATPIDKDISKKPKPSERKSEPTPIVTHHDLVIDGKVVKASYNADVKERVVHVTEIKKDENDSRSRFIIGACPTVLDRNGEWGAALSVLDALAPVPGDRVILVSGDAGFCIEEFCKWLNEKGFFYIFRIKENAGNIFLRVQPKPYLMIINANEKGNGHPDTLEWPLGGEIISRLRPNNRLIKEENR